jgi:hypothetical protein
VIDAAYSTSSNSHIPLLTFKKYASSNPDESFPFILKLPVLHVMKVQVRTLLLFRTFLLMQLLPSVHKSSVNTFLTKMFHVKHFIEYNYTCWSKLALLTCFFDSPHGFCFCLSITTLSVLSHPLHVSGQIALFASHALITPRQVCISRLRIFPNSFVNSSPSHPYFKEVKKI